MSIAGNVPTGFTQLRILVIDDDDLVLQMLGRLLKMHAVTLSLSAKEALAKIAQANERFDAIICDVHMRGMGGYQFCEELGKSCPEAARRVIMMSGAGEFADARPSLTKPFRLKEFEEAFEKLGSAQSS
jgi:CheY-like chemotaxis protein